MHFNYESLIEKITNDCLKECELGKNPTHCFIAAPTFSDFLKDAFSRAGGFYQGLPTSTAGFNSMQIATPLATLR